jgi:hypothetical protein
MQEEYTMESRNVQGKAMLAASLGALAARADEFGRGSWTGPGRAALERAIIGAAPLLDQPVGLGEEAERLRQLIEASCRALLAKMKTATVDGARFEVDCGVLVQACNSLLSLLR